MVYLKPFTYLLIHSFFLSFIILIFLFKNEKKKKRDEFDEGVQNAIDTELERSSNIEQFEDGNEILNKITTFRILDCLRKDWEEKEIEKEKEKEKEKLELTMEKEKNFSLSELYQLTMNGNETPLQTPTIKAVRKSEKLRRSKSFQHTSNPFKQTPNSFRTQKSKSQFSQSSTPSHFLPRSHTPLHPPKQRYSSSQPLPTRVTFDESQLTQEVQEEDDDVVFQSPQKRDYEEFDDEIPTQIIQSQEETPLSQDLFPVSKPKSPQKESQFLNSQENDPFSQELFSYPTHSLSQSRVQFQSQPSSLSQILSQSSSFTSPFSTPRIHGKKPLSQSSGKRKSGF